MIVFWIYGFVTLFLLVGQSSRSDERPPVELTVIEHKIDSGVRLSYVLINRSAHKLAGYEIQTEGAVTCVVKSKGPVKAEPDPTGERVTVPQSCTFTQKPKSDKPFELKTRVVWTRFADGFEWRPKP